ncbi:unnamed protein product, partial [marine sediment metagenome]
PDDFAYGVYNDISVGDISVITGTKNDLDISDMVGGGIYKGTDTTINADDTLGLDSVTGSLVTINAINNVSVYTGFQAIIDNSDGGATVKAFSANSAFEGGLNDTGNPTIAYYSDWDIAGTMGEPTDASQKVWTFYNDSPSDERGGKMFLGKDNVGSYFGDAYDSKIQYNGVDLNIIPNLVGNGVVFIDNGLTVQGDLNILGDLNITGNIDTQGVSFNEGGIIATGDSNFANIGVDENY